MREMNVRWIEERTERMKTGREREEEERVRKEKEDRQRRERNVVFRGVEGEDRKERRCFIIEIMWKVLGRVVRLRGIEERREKAERWVLLVKRKEIADKKEVLERGEERASLGGRGGRGLVYGGEEIEMEDDGSGQERKSEREKGSGDKQGVMSRRKKMALGRGKEVLD